MSSKEFEGEVERILRVEIPHWFYNNGTNFTSVLLQLIQKADPSNRHKLSTVYPSEVEAFKRWEAQRSEASITVPPVGAVVTAGVAFVDVKPGMRGVVYEHYSREQFDETAGIGISIVFESGFYDSFSSFDREHLQIEETGKLIPELEGYVFENVTKLSNDFRKGLFSKAFEK